MSDDDIASEAECEAFLAKKLALLERRALANPEEFLRKRGIDPSGDAAAKVRAEFAKDRGRLAARPKVR